MPKKPFDRATDYVIAAFIVGVILMLTFCEESRADVSYEYWHDSNSGITDFNSGLDQLGVRYTWNSGASFYLSPLVAVGGRVNRIGRDSAFFIGFGENIGERWQAQLNLAFYEDEAYGGASLRRYVGDGPFQLSLGLTYWIDESPGSDSDVTFNLGMRYLRR